MEHRAVCASGADVLVLDTAAVEVSARNVRVLPLAPTPVRFVFLSSDGAVATVCEESCATHYLASNLRRLAAEAGDTVDRTNTVRDAMSGLAVEKGNAAAKTAPSVVGRDGAKGLSLAGHKAGVVRVVYSGDSTLIATGSTDGSVRVFAAHIDPGSGGGEQEPLHTVAAHRGWVTAIAFADEDRLIVSGGTDGVAQVWAAASGERLASLPDHGSDVWAVAAPPTTPPAAIRFFCTAGGDGVVRVWSCRDFTCLASVDVGAALAAQFPDAGAVVKKVALQCCSPSCALSPAVSNMATLMASTERGVLLCDLVLGAVVASVPLDYVLARHCVPHSVVPCVVTARLVAPYLDPAAVDCTAQDPAPLLLLPGDV